MNSKERMFLVALLSVWLGPLLDHLAVPKADQPQAVGWVVIGIFALYHAAAQLIQAYGPRIRARTLDRWFPPLSAPAPRLTGTEQVAIARVVLSEIQKGAPAGAPARPTDLASSAHQE